MTNDETILLNVYSSFVPRIHNVKQWFSTALTRAAYGTQAPFVRLSAVFH